MAGGDIATPEDPAWARELRDTALPDGGYPSLDRLARTAADLTGASTALVTLVDGDHQVLSGAAGVGDAFGRQVLSADAPVVITDRGGRGCAGFPLRSADGRVLGSFCVIDTHPRQWAPAELALVEALATAAETEIALRTANRELARTSRHIRSVLDTAQDAFVSADSTGTITTWNGAAERLFGYPTAEALGHRVADLIIPARLHAAHEAGIARIRAGEASRLAGKRLQLVAVDRVGHEFPVEMTLQVMNEDHRLGLHAFLHDVSHREAAQRQLEDERTFLQALLDSLDTGVAACDADGRIAVRNRALRDLFELDSDQISAGRLYGADGRTPLAPDDVPLARAFAGERVIGQHLTVRAADGRRRRFVVNGQPITTAEGRHLGAVAALHEITEQYRAETLREAQHAVARALADADSAEQAATDTIAAVATALNWTYGEFWYADPGSETISRVGSWTLPGYDLGAFGGPQQMTFGRGEGLAGIVWDTDAELWIPEVADDVRTAARREQARQAGLHTAIGLPVRSDNQTLGVLLFFTTTVDEPDNDLLTMLDGVCAHLGRHFERRRAEDLTLALAAARRAFDRVIAQVNDYVWTFEILPGGTPKAIYATPDSSGIFGGQLPAGSDMATSMGEHVEPEDQPRMVALRATVIAGRPAETEVRVHGMDGVTRWVWIRAVPREDGGRLFVDGIATDVTDRRELADQRERLLADQRQQNRQLRELDRMKDEIVALVSHELRNPLSTIAAHTEMLLEATDLTADQRQLATVIDKHSKHMHGLVDDLLDLASLEAGRIAIDPRPVPLARIVQDSTDDQRPTAEAKQLTITVDVPLNLPVFADPARLRQVLDNLVSNAIKYTPTGGTIRITGGRDEARSTPATVLTVADSGIGIPEDQYQHLFDRFFRASNAISEGIKGTGLGLAITKAIIDAHAGTIRAEPGRTGGGTTFTLTLPATPPAERV